MIIYLNYLSSETVVSTLTLPNQLSFNQNTNHLHNICIKIIFIEMY